MEKKNPEVTHLLNELTRRSVQSNSSYDTLLSAWPLLSQQHTEAKADQGDLSDALAVLIAERDMARAEATLAKAQLRLARKAMSVLSSEEGTAILIREGLLAAPKKR